MVQLSSGQLIDAARRNISAVALRRQGLTEQQISQIRQIRQRITPQPVAPRPTALSSVDISNLIRAEFDKVKAQQLAIGKATPANRTERKALFEKRKVLVKAIKDIGAGRIEPSLQVIAIANAAAEERRVRRQLAAERKAREKVFLSRLRSGEGEITKIQFKKGKPTFVIVDGARISLRGFSPADLKQIQLSSVRRAKQLQPFLNKLAVKKPSISQTDFDRQVLKFKGAVNKELTRFGQSPIALSNSLTDFQKRLDRLVGTTQKLEIDIRKLETEKAKEVLSKELQARVKLLATIPVPKSIKDKLIAGKPLTEKEQGIFFATAVVTQPIRNVIFIAKLSKKVLTSPFNYGKSLVNRFNAGENNPLSNDVSKLSPKRIGIGALKETGDILNFFLGVKGVTINSQGESFDGVIAKGARALIEYSAAVTKAYQQGAGSAKVKSDIARAIGLSRAGSQKVIDVQRFIREKPLVAATVAGGAITLGAISSRNAFLKNPNENLGRALLFFAPTKAVRNVGKGLAKTGKRIDAALFSKTDLNTIVRQISTLDKIKGKSRGQIQLQKSLRGLLAVEKDLLRARQGIGKIDTGISKGTLSPVKAADTARKINVFVPQIIKKKRASTNALKLRPDTISKGLNKLFQEQVITVTKVTKPSQLKTLPLSIIEIQKLLIDARRIGGAEFSVLRKRIKNQLGLNVVQRGSGRDIRFKLLEPKENRKKGIQTRRKKLFVITADGRIVDISKRKGVKQLKEINKLTDKDLKDLEFSEGQNLNLLQNDFRRIANKTEFFGNKKAQLRMVNTFKKHVKSNRIKVDRVKVDTQKLNRRVQIHNKSLKAPIKSREQSIKLKVDSISLQRSTQKLKSRSLMLQSQTSILKSLSALLGALGFAIASVFAQISAQALDIAQVIKNINKFKFPIPTPTKPIRAIPRSREVPQLIRPTPVKKPKRIKKPIRKIPTKLRRILRRPIKKIIKPIRKRRIDLGFDTKLPKGISLAVDIFFREKGRVRRANLRLPLNRGLKRLAQLLDNTTSRSAEIRIVGVTKQKDIKPPSLIKFRPRKTKKVLRLVEKRKFAIDKLGEKRGLRLARMLKKSSVSRRKKKK